MKKLYTFFIILLIFSCKTQTELEPFKQPNVNLLSVFSKSETEGEANILIENVSTELEVGLVWAEKSNPTISDFRQSFSNIKEPQSLFVLLTNLIKNKTYYIRAYFKQNDKITYSTDEIVLIHSFSNAWIRYNSPKVVVGEYISADGILSSGSRGGYVFYKVDMFTNTAKETIFYPFAEDWDLDFFQRNTPTSKPMRFNPFNVSFRTSGNVNATMVGGGYYRYTNNTKFFLKDYKIDGIDGYKWEPEYPGANVSTTGFGINGYGYVLENSSEGKLWKFDTNSIKWEAVSNVPVAKEAKFVSFDTGERGFVLVESENWTDELNSFYEYDPITNIWNKKMPFPGENRRRGVAFSFNNKVYYGAGQSTKSLKGLRDIWEYNPTTDNWKKVADYPGSGTINLISVTISNTIFIGFGQQIIANSINGERITDVNDFWKFDPK